MDCLLHLKPRTGCNKLLLLKSTHTSLFRPPHNAQNLFVMSFQRTPETTSGTATTWIPLTTAAPSSAIDDCSAARYSAINQTSQHQLTAFDPFFPTIIQTDFKTRCFGLEATSWWDVVRYPKTGDNKVVSVTSLGPLVCPGGYTTAATSPAGDRTHVACCPS
jgi:hypothetical protein